MGYWGFSFQLVALSRCRPAAKAKGPLMSCSSGVGQGVLVTESLFPRRKGQSLLPVCRDVQWPSAILHLPSSQSVSQNTDERRQAATVTWRQGTHSFEIATCERDMAATGVLVALWSAYMTKLELAWPVQDLSAYGRIRHALMGFNPSEKVPQGFGLLAKDVGPQKISCSPLFLLTPVMNRIVTTLETKRAAEKATA